MSVRRDKLVLLIDTGTSSHVRKTASKQLSDLTLKQFQSARPSSSSSSQSGTIKTEEQIKEEVDIKPVNPDAVTLRAEVSEDEAWDEVLETISKLIPLLKSKQSESRNAAANALGLIASVLPSYNAATSLPETALLDVGKVDVLDVVKNGKVLLASAGREYIAKPGPGDKAKSRKAMMASMGIGEGIGWGEDVDNVIGDDDDMNGQASNSKNSIPAPPTPSTLAPPSKDIFEGLSARQITMLKRKKGNIVEEANKMRKLNEKANGSSALSSPSATPTPADSPGKMPSPLPHSTSSEAITIDPGAKARAAAAAGGQVEPVVDAEGNVIVPEEKYKLKLVSGVSPWITILLELMPFLDDAGWQARHGSSVGIMEILRSLPTATIPVSLITAISRHLLNLMILDRFGDFLGDIVVAPVREAAAQCLGICLKYMNKHGVSEVHDTLVEMVRQKWAKRGKQNQNQGKSDWEKFRWEIRHAGLLGLKYLVAVRPDLLKGESVSSVEGDVKPNIDAEEREVREENEDEDEDADEEDENDGKEGSNRRDLTMLQSVVDATMLSMKDVDDDVRTVAAAALVPITGTLASTLSRNALTKLFLALWDCLKEGGDELGSSVGALLDLLGSMLDQPAVVEIYAAAGREDDLGPHDLTQYIYPYARHPIHSVRLAVATILNKCANDPTIREYEWAWRELYYTMFGNVMLDQDPNIRRLSSDTFKKSMQEATDQSKGCHGIPSWGDIVENDDWFKMIMTPVGQPYDADLFPGTSKGRGIYNVDKPMLQGDLGLIDSNLMWETRMEGANILAWLDGNLVESNETALTGYLDTGSAHQSIMACIIIQQWFIELPEEFLSGLYDKTEKSKLEVIKKAVSLFEAGPMEFYEETKLMLKKIQTECQALLTAFTAEGKLPKSSIPQLPTVDSTQKPFTLSTAQETVTGTFENLASQLSKSTSKNVITSLRDRQRKVIAMIGQYGVMKEGYDIRVSAALASALVYSFSFPVKFGGTIKAIMDSIKKEEIAVLQKGSADSMALFIQHCFDPRWRRPVNPADKVIKNLFTFMCSDTTITPLFNSDTIANNVNGIITLQEEKETVEKVNVAKKGRKGLANGEDAEESESQRAMRITRRGALETFKSLSTRFGDDLFEKVKKVWEVLSDPLLTNFGESTNVGEIDSKLSSNTQQGQDMIDALTSLRLIAPELPVSLHARISTLIKPVIMVLQSNIAILRNSAAKCLSTLSDIMTHEALRAVVDHVVPLIGDATRVSARRGAVEAVHHIIRTLDIKALPYVLFLIVPILGRMSDPDESVRLLSTSTFASLVRMVPLEAGIPDPPGFSAELLARRDEERKFLMQLLDGSKAEQYQIPIKIKADLRQYQKDGVSWLAFLAKYQLHGILCDDMGLGKSLQSICIIGSKHQERLLKHRQTNSPDSKHLPSLIVCPPTLTGHWYYEILKFTDELRPVQYVGSMAERQALKRDLEKYDVVITSYETLRSDILSTTPSGSGRKEKSLGDIDWLYCVLDEGHIIKNSKTKLSLAVKKIKSQHRLLLSGTPIQNNLLELWSLFDFLMPGFLGTERSFQEKFGKPVMADKDGKATPKEREAAAAALESLHKQVLPFLLRRLKEDVLSDLPPKIIQDYYCDLSPLQAVLYDEFSKSRAAEEAGQEVQSDTAGSGHVFQSLQYLRKLCNHPALVLDNAQSGAGKFEELKARAGLSKDVQLKDVDNAPKLQALRQLLNDCGIGLPPTEKMDDNSSHRVLIFCQLRTMLDLIESTLFKDMPSVSYMRMDGSTDPRKRHAVVQTFNNDPRIDVLLLTTSVGGLGLNLTGADTVIFVDHDWNPMKDLQAMDRAHRLGQRKVVNVYRLIMRGTLEEKIMGLQRFKLNIASSVVTQQNAGLGSMNTGEVLDLFKVSAEPEGGKARAKETGGPTSAAKILEGLEDLPPDDEYADLTLSNFLSKV